MGFFRKRAKHQHCWVFERQTEKYDGIFFFSYIILKLTWKHLRCVEGTNVRIWCNLWFLMEALIGFVQTTKGWLEMLEWSCLFMIRCDFGNAWPYKSNGEYFRFSLVLFDIESKRLLRIQYCDEYWRVQKCLFMEVRSDEQNLKRI